MKLFQQRSSQEAMQHTLIICMILAVSILIVQTMLDKQLSFSNTTTLQSTTTVVNQKETTTTTTKPTTTKTPTTTKKQTTTTQEMTTIKSTKYVYNITSEERKMLAALVYLEANVESIECQRAIVSVIINRWKSGYWGKSLYSVIYAPNQFSPANLISSTTPTATNYAAVDYVLKNDTTLPSYVLYFRANYHFNWSGYVPYTKISNTCFGYMSKDR
jgi:spore germination cell wall hydrolase CwlJ-like protein